MAAVTLQVIPIVNTIISKYSLFVSGYTYVKYIESKQTCTPLHGDKMCFLPICRHHNKKIGEYKELLQKMDAICFIYQHVDFP